MGSKLATILSFYFFFICSLFLLDLINVGVLYSSLEAVGSNASIIFSKNGGMNAKDKVDSYIKTMLGEETNLEIVKENSAVGEMLIFCISKDYKCLFISQESIHISISRSAYIGAYSI